jgi:hypothetical protein
LEILLLLWGVVTSLQQVPVVQLIEDLETANTRYIFEMVLFVSVVDPDCVDLLVSSVLLEDHTVVEFLEFGVKVAD